MNIYFEMHPDDLPAGPNWYFYFTKSGPLFVLMEDHNLSVIDRAFGLLLPVESSTAPLHLMAEPDSMDLYFDVHPSCLCRSARWDPSLFIESSPLIVFSDRVLTRRSRLETIPWSVMASMMSPVQTSKPLPPVFMLAEEGTR